MLYTQLRFESFLNIQAYCKLQMEFLKYDEDYPKINRLIKNPEENLSITIQDLFEYEDDPTLSSQISREIKFEKDFLLPSIDLMAKNYFEMLQNEADVKGILTLEGRDTYAQKKIILIRSYRDKIKDVVFLTNEIKELLSSQLLIIEDRLTSWIHNPVTDFKKKIQFNLIRADVIYFFHLLKMNKVIEEMKDAELGNIIDNVCTCLPNENSKAYIPITNSRSTLNDYRNSNNNNSIEKSIVRIQRFINSNFFNH